MTTTPTTPIVAAADPPVPPTTYPPCAFDGDPACGPIYVPADIPPDPTVRDLATPAPVTLPIVPGVEMCLPSGTMLMTIIPCKPECGYVTYEHGEIVCHGAVLPSSEVHSLPATGTTSASITGGAGALLALGLVLARIAHRTSRPVRSSR